MVWREEGIGDEMRFASCLPELAEMGFGRVIFECAPRLASLFGRSFPTITVRGEAPGEGPEDYDLQAPLFSLPGLLRPSLDDFPDRPAYLTADPERARAWRNRLQALGPGPTVGVCWRSLNFSWQKRPFHSRIADWAPVLRLPGLTFIDLQVEAAADEIAEARESFGATIHTLEGLDLKDDLEGVAAVISVLDAVVSARCWIPILSGALGVPTSCFAAPFNPLFLGQARDPWMPMVQIFTRRADTDWRAPMAAIADQLGRLRPDPG